MNNLELLERFAEGTLGLCQSCGQEIRTIRLRALPWARLCMGCREAAERRERILHR